MIQNTRGFSMLGVLVTLVCIVILFSIAMNAMRGAVTGRGSAVSGTVRSVQDEISLYSLYQGMIAAGNESRQSQFPVPSIIAGNDDATLNTTANLYSAMIARNYAAPNMLVSGNEYSPFVNPITGYNYNAYQPQLGIYWDTAFQADLSQQSHVSFAHMPLFGERFRRGWKPNHDRQFVLIGNRGPENGIDNPNSYSYGRSGIWGGHVLYGDGSISFTHDFILPGDHADNLFNMDDGPDGADAILSFTRGMHPSGPELQFD